MWALGFGVAHGVGAELAFAAFGYRRWDWLSCWLAGLLDGRVGRPVIDRTGLDSAFDLDLEWSSDLGLRPAPGGSAGAAGLSPDGLSLFTALREQLGLELEPGRGSVTILVIDSAEPPTAD